MERDYQGGAAKGVEPFLRELIENAGQINGAAILDISTIEDYFNQPSAPRGVIATVEGVNQSNHKVRIEVTVDLDLPD